MLRVHFTADDLARVRVASSADPLWELLLSAHMLQKRDATVVFGQWRRDSRAALRELSGPGLGPLLRLMPPIGYSPDFLTPAAGSTDLDEGVDTVLSTPRQKITSDLSRLGTRPPLADTAAPTLRALGAALRRYHHTVLAPHWPQVTAAVAADRARRATDLLSGGVEALLRTLIPGARWTAPVWHLPFYVDDDLHLGGRGLLLVPSFFCWQHPTRLLDPVQPPVLAYPVAQSPDWMRPGQPPCGVVTLLGQTRAAVLDTLADNPATTTGIAGRLRITASTASHHCTALREAGLLVTRRQGKSVQHSATDLGRALLNRPQH